MVFEDSPWSVDEAWRKLCHEHDEFITFSDGDAGDPGSWLSSRWQPPRQGAVKLNVDGSFWEQDRCMGAGGLIRDDQGKWLCGFYAHRRGGMR